MLNSLLERFKSPVIGNFIITWLAFNWKVPYITLFLDQEHTGKYASKLEAVEAILNKTSFCTLYMYPIITTLVLIFAVPGLNYVAGIFPSFLSFVKTKDEMRKDQELNGLKSETTNLRNELNRLENLNKNDLLIRIGYKAEKVENIFPGTWKIFNEYSNRSSNHNNCYVKDNIFIDDKQKIPVLTIKSIKANADGNDRRPIAICTIEQTLEEKEYFVNVSKRDEIIFNEKGDHMHRIIFNWNNMPNY